MILIGLGANLSGPSGPPRATLEAALAELARELTVLARSRWWRAAPVPASDQPWFTNGVALLDTALGPAALLARLHEIEARLGRVRGAANAARAIDLDLLAHGGTVGEGPPVLPHPRLHLRAFVLLPLAEVAPGWVHPRLGLGVSEMIARLPAAETGPLAIRPES
ncbi:MAG: 2-amino-4-hydroxy-6-hydroxymethyldihydropteridine diphosphokinase [Alphaproteobacteria bacterium]|nr:2-amino-4-hydroxy-6-hydroxymethyldihydropteridine diphosphokinase [Alphaproteobacteria bacterium]